MKNQVLKRMQRFLKDEEGATAVEYGIMVALIAAVIIVAVTGLGQKVEDVFSDVDTRMPLPPATTGG